MEMFSGFGGEFVMSMCWLWTRWVQFLYNCSVSYPL